MKYKKIRAIGEGGLATVFKVEDSRGRIWALKELRSGPVNLKQRLRFKREIGILSTLSHPNIVPVVDYDADAPLPFYVMPVAEGSLGDSISRFRANADTVYSVASQ